MDGTPIFDIKPYRLRRLPSGRRGRLASAPAGGAAVGGLRSRLPGAGARGGGGGPAGVGPRPQTRLPSDPGRVYGLSFGGVDVRFTLAGGALTVVDVVPGGGEMR